MGFFGRVLAGAVAGVVGTAVMDAVWYRRYQDDGGTDTPLEWEFATSTASFEDATAPGQVGKRVAAVAGVDLPEESAGTTTNVVHWLTGAGYGVLHSLLQDERGVPGGGIRTGLGAFGGSYALLGWLGIYEPVWTYDSDTLSKDLTAHLAYGMGTSLAYKILT